jgi:hypothetical protein
MHIAALEDYSVLLKAFLIFMSTFGTAADVPIMINAAAFKIIHSICA